MTIVEPADRLGAIAGELATTRAFTEALAQPLSEADQTAQSMPDTSPTKWHRAHTTWFFEAFVLGPLGSGYEPFDPNFSYLFNSYYEAVGDRYPRPRRGMVTRPGVAGIEAYRRSVDQALGELVEACGQGRSDRFDRPTIAALIELGIHHEQQHQELLLMDIKHVLANNLFDTAYRPRAHQPVADPGPLGWVDHPGGLVEVGFDPRRGADPDWPDGHPSNPSGEPGPVSSFRFDNEGPCHQALVPPHALADRLITCGEWLAFMADGGYRNPQLWLSDGWYAARERDWTAPEYWAEDDGGWVVHTLNGTRPVDPNEPVCHLSFYEADAFATWAGARLPTEFEWEAATTGPWTPGAFLAPHQPPSSSTLDASALHPGSACGGGGSGGVVRGLFGDCWEWTGSPYRPYPGYQVPDGAVGEYNGKFMINTMVMRGGCAFTPPGHIRSTYRNFFHPHTRWHLSGVRLARDAN